jgi:hypothetical protein
MEVSKNKAKYSQLDNAIKLLNSKPENIHKYLNTIQIGIECLNRSQIDKLKSLVIDGCKNTNMNFIPSEKKPICEATALNTVKMLGKCYCDGEKAQGIKEFPGKIEKTKDKI